MEYNRIDTDSHIQEKPDTWTSRMSKAKWGDRIPHIEDRDGVEQWIIDGTATGSLATCPAVMPDRVTWPTKWDMIPEGVYEANGRMKYMDHDKIDAAVMYPNVTGPSGGRFQNMEPDLEADCVRAYNDVQTEEWLGVNPDRFIAMTVPPYSDMERMIGEVTYNANNGHKGVVLVGTPHIRNLPHYSDRYWDPLWQTIVDCGIIASVHGSGDAPQTMRLDQLPGTEFRRSSAAVAATGFTMHPQYLTTFLFAGVLDRFPDLIFVSAETGIGWLPWLLESCDYAWEKGQLWNHGLPTRPSELFHRHCYVDFWYELSAIQEYRYVIGVDRIMWETDFPHPTALWPDTEAFLQKALKGVPEDEQRMILVENPKKVYHLE